VCLPDEFAEHSPGIVNVTRLSKDFCSERDNGVGTEYDRVRMPKSYSGRLQLGIEAHKFARSQEGRRYLFHFRTNHLRMEARFLKQLDAPRRTGSQNEAVHGRNVSACRRTGIWA
jgi:hypothetical protein